MYTLLPAPTKRWAITPGEIGYSMPDDDTEIRTLLRAGYERGTANPKVIVRNPAPDVHVRIRTQITNNILSDYSPVPPI